MILSRTKPVSTGFSNTPPVIPRIAAAVDCEPLHAEAYRGNVEQVELLLMQNKTIRAQINARDKSGWTALHLACQYGRIAVAMSLLRLGQADIDARDEYLGWTPLHCATKGGNLQLIEYLLEEGANVFCTDKQGKTALQGTDSVAIQNLLRTAMRMARMNTFLLAALTSTLDSQQQRSPPSNTPVSTTCMLQTHFFLHHLFDKQLIREIYEFL